MTNEEKLLIDIVDLSKKYDLLLKHTGGYFNIFDILGKAHDEVAICRMISELLSVTGSHYQNDVYLKLFFESVLNIPISDKELKTAKVYREYQIDNNRRIDIAIETESKFIPIEVKIYAGEQESQCYDYYKKAKNSKLYYLTRFGEAPSEWSAKGLTKNGDGYDEITTISFAENILDWLEMCMRNISTLNISPIREILSQFIGIIRRFTGKMESDKEMEIKKLITSSPENMKSAMMIQSSLDNIKVSMMEKFFSSIEDKVSAEKVYDDYDYEQKINKYYLRQHSNCPGISFKYESKEQTDIDIFVRVEIEHDVFVGYYCPQNGMSKGKVFSSENLKTLLDFKTLTDTDTGFWCDSYWWPYYEICLLDTESPNFHDFNDTYFKLFDEVNFDKFSSTVADKIEFLLNL